MTRPKNHSMNHPTRPAVPPAADVAFVELPWDGRLVRIEYRLIEPATVGRAAPLMVFLHEGLGSVSMWRDFPDQLCAAAGLRGLVYSRPGYGRSTPRALGEAWGPDFMHRQAAQLLPALLPALGVHAQGDPPWLFGHSDGGSIALLYAAAPARPLAGVVVMAPHIVVETVSIDSIERARQAYAQGELRQRLSRHHDEPDSAFCGWAGAWLSPAFRHWSITDEIGSIRCPLLALQGSEDEYGTLEQILGIARRVPQAELLELAGCGHSPHREQPQLVIDAVAGFVQRHRRAAAQP